MKSLIKQLKDTPSLEFDPNHTTVPIIFLKGKFLGGYDKLKEHFDKISNIYWNLKFLRGYAICNSS